MKRENVTYLAPKDIRTAFHYGTLKQNQAIIKLTERVLDMILKTTENSLVLPNRSKVSAKMQASVYRGSLIHIQGLALDCQNYIKQILSEDLKS